MGLIRTAGGVRETPELQTPSHYSLVPTSNTPHVVTRRGTEWQHWEQKYCLSAGLLTASTVHLRCCILLGRGEGHPMLQALPCSSATLALSRQLHGSWKSCHSRKTALSAWKQTGTATIVQICRNGDKWQLCYPLHFSDSSSQKHFTQVSQSCCSRPWSLRLRQCQFFPEWVSQYLENSYLWATWNKHNFIRKQITE